ncbi:MAG: amidase [Alphaproteobacteria bacterium]|nr:amidase [Alphaproteobacteria bacterium]
MTSTATALHFLTVAEAGRLIRARRLSPVELVDAHLDRIARVDPRIHSYITVLADRARAAARDTEAAIMRGDWRGPLHGIPYGLKDNFYTRGIRTTAASRLMLDHVPDVDATAHARLRDAGAILLGKLNTYEYGTGTGAVHFDLPFEPARNPWDTTRFTGGSSTGPGAAVAAGTAMAALGSDTGGSVRLPAAGCGVVGLKPTYGRVSRAGVQPNCWTQDHIGPLAWTVEDAAILLQVIAGHDAADPACADRPVPDFSAGLGQGVAGLRLGVIRRFHTRDVAGEPAIVAGFEAAIDVFRRLGATIVELELDAGLNDFRACSRVVNAAESYSIHERDFVERHAEMGRALRDKMMGGALLRAADYLRAMRWRRELAASLDDAISACDAVVCCGATRIAPRFEDGEAVVAFTGQSAMAAFNLSGHPALSLCNGFSPEGLPLNLQIAGRFWDEATVLRVAAAYERATPWRDRRPMGDDS